MLKEYKLAALHIKIASKLTTGFSQAKTQKALVEAFLGNHQQVHVHTQDLCKKKPSVLRTHAISK